MVLFRTACLVLAIALSVVVAPSTGRAEVIDFSSGFGTPAGLTANGNATFTGGVARLTDGGFGEAGTVFSTAPVTITQFSTTFTFQLHGGTVPSADGITWTAQAGPATALGPAGGGLGYGPDFPGGTGGIPNSVAVKFDLFNNAGEGINSTGLYLNGASPTVPAIDLTPSGIDLHSQHLFEVGLAYDGTTLSEMIQDLTTLAFFTTSFTIGIPANVGGPTAHVGFSGGTGALTSIQDILTWRFESPGAAVPEPGTLLLLGSGGLGLGALAWRRHRRK